MLKLGVVLILLAQSSITITSGLRGRNDDGDCVKPCRRGDGLPCQPCLPGTGPGAVDWDKAVREFAGGNERFGVSIRERAERDPAYRVGQFVADRRAYQEMRDAARDMENISRLNPRDSLEPRSERQRPERNQEPRTGRDPE